MSNKDRRSLTTTIAANIKRAQRETPLNTEELARELGVTARLVHKWRAGDHAPSLGNIQKLSDVFGLPADWFFSEKGDEV